MRIDAIGAMHVAAAVAVAGTLAACQSGTGPLDEAGFERQLHALGSVAMEAAFVADQAHAGHLTAPYVRAHIAKLLDDAAAASHELARPSLPALAGRQQTAQALAAQLTGTLRVIAATPPGAAPPLLQQEDVATRLKHQLDALGGAT